MTDDGDRIERTIEIDAEPDRVWDLVSEPGWWINEGSIRQHRIERDGDVSVVHDAQYGAFRIRTVQLDRPAYAAFRWLPQEGDTQDGSTLVEFWITAGPSGGVTLRVLESGFEALDVSAAERRKKIEENTEGWSVELAAARAHLSPTATTPVAGSAAAPRLP
jgi:uncharacterized protein YndB with AHSA1/START domain